MAIIDDIFNILRGANPDAPEADLHAQAVQLSQHPDAASAMQPISGPPPSAPTPPANAPSSFDVGVSDNTVTQNGSPASVGAAPFHFGGTDQGATPLGGASADIPAVTPPVMAPSSSAPMAPKTAPVVPPVTPPVSSPVAPSSSDQDTRNTGLEDAANRRKMSVIPAAIAGVGDAVNNSLKAFGMNGETDREGKILERAKADYETNKGAVEEKISNDPNSEASKSARALVLQIAPNMANDPNFNSMSDKMLRDKLPLVDTMMKAKASEDARKIAMSQAQSNKDLSMSLREDQQQDKLEQNAKQMVSNLRGDKSLARAEEQRDAAIVAYNRINEVQKSGKGLNPIDYTDILGQIYKARTGNAPGEQVLGQIRQATAQGSLGKAYTFATGEQAPATSQAITNSLKDMAQSMGKQADEFHDGYMKAHLIKPHNLDDDRWKPIAETGRGISFADATKLHQAAANASGTSQGGQRTTAAGHSYSVSQ